MAAGRSFPLSRIPKPFSVRLALHGRYEGTHHARRLPELAGLLDAPEIERLVSEPEASRSTASGQHDSLELALHE